MSMQTPNLLPYQKALVSEAHDSKTSDLILLARGLGLRKVVCTFLQIYDGPQNLVLLLNSDAEEEKGIGSELGTMGVRNPGLRIVDYEMSKKDRQSLYRKGGLISVTSRILVVDLLLKDIPVDLITGMVIMHAEKVTPTSLESFIVRLYRTTNKEGFIKAFSDQPEQFTQGMFPLKTVMTELHIRRTHIYPRFHENVQTSLGRRKADVVELYVPMTSMMKDIHQGIIHCISATLNELKRSNSLLDLDDFNVENAYFKSFDAIVRRQLDPVWHKVGVKTKQLVSDLGTLRRLLTYLLTLDPISFLSYLETIVSSSAPTSSHPLARQEKSDWLFTEAAHLIITNAKARCYTMDANVGGATMREPDSDEDYWDILNEMEGGAHGSGPANPNPDWRPWMPPQMNPVLEEPGKWSVLADVLLEIEQEMLSRPYHLTEPGTNTVLVMVSESRTASLLQDYLSTMQVDPETPGRTMLEKRLRSYLFWKSILARGGPAADSLAHANGRPAPETSKEPDMSEALKRKDQRRADAKQARRRVRGGGTMAPSQRERKKELERTGMLPDQATLEMEAETIASFIATQADVPTQPTNSGRESAQPFASSVFAPTTQATQWQEEELFLDNDDFGLLLPEQIVVVRAYGDDGDDQILNELRPRYIVMYDPNQDFVRRVEVYRGSNPGLAVRVYFMLYHLTSEEHKYLAGQRREKVAFERLIKERGSMLLTIGDPAISSYSEKVAALSTRIGGGQAAPVEPPRVIVDMREFRSSLPNLIDKAKLQVIPATLTVGDYILTPDMCVERKSLPDLIQSFTSGRLFTQCELMSAHYNYPILLIEFEETKSFSLQSLADTKTNPKSKKPDDKNVGPPKSSNANDNLIQSKLVLLTLTFPRLRIIWSSSPYQSAEIIRDLKNNFPEPDVAKAILMGAEDDTTAGDDVPDVNTLAEDLLRTLPGVGTKNLRYVMSRVDSVTALCTMSQEDVQELLGVEPGKKCYDFIHQGLQSRHPPQPTGGR